MVLRRLRRPSFNSSLLMKKRKTASTVTVTAAPINAASTCQRDSSTFRSAGPGRYQMERMLVATSPRPVARAKLLSVFKRKKTMKRLPPFHKKCVHEGGDKKN